MPQRFLRPGITNSERWNGASFEAQSLFIRLLTRVDDYGRFDGRLSVIHATCFTVWNEKHPEKAISQEAAGRLCEELKENGLVVFYESEGKRVLQMEQWHERTRTKSVWPGRQGGAGQAAHSYKAGDIMAAVERQLAVAPASGGSSGQPPRHVPVEGVDDGAVSFGRAKPSAGNVNQAVLPAIRRKLEEMFHRDEGAPWSNMEERGLVDVCAQRPEVWREFQEIARFQRKLKPEDRKWFPQKLGKLLEDWTGVLDRARAPQVAAAPRNGECVINSRTPL